MPVSGESVSPLPQPGRLPSLDGWRAVAIAFVLFSHFTAARDFSPPWWWTRVFQGNLGVRIFFVISGLLITYLLLVEADRRGRPSLRAFYTRRVLRIFPVYFLYLAVVASLALVGLYSDTTTSWLGSLTFTRNLIGPLQSLTGHYWSLAVEEQFYVIWPITLVTLRLWERPRLAVALLLVPIVLSPIVRTNVIQLSVNNAWIDRALSLYSTPRYADSLALGCLGAFAYWRWREPLERLASDWMLVAALIVFAGAAAADADVPSAAPLIPLVQAAAVLCAMWVTVCRRSGVVYTILNLPLVLELGILSYSLYVWEELFLSWAAGPRLSTFAVYGWRIWWLPALAAAIASYYLVERPILRIRDRYRRVPDAESRAEAMTFASV